MTLAFLRARRSVLAWWLGMAGCPGMAGCAGNTSTPAPVATVRGTERLEWNQAAADAVELASFQYAIYVDNVRSELGGVSCTPSPAAADFTCLAPLPSMRAGPHSLELATFIVNGEVFESARSAPLSVLVTASLTSTAQSPTVWPSSLVTSDRVTLRLERVTDGLVAPTALAFVPDGRIFVAERSGRVRIVRNGRLGSEPALSLTSSGSGQEQLLALAVDPRFDQTHFVYAIFTASSRAGGTAFCLARFREASGTLADRAVLLDEVPASPVSPAASLRFGSDGKLYAAFDDGGNRRLAGDLASPSGKILRLNPDGTTPDDQAGGTPLYSYAYDSPRGFDWDPGSQTLWIADQTSRDSGRLSAVASDVPRIRGVVRKVFELPRGTVPSSVAFYRGDLIPPFRNSLLIGSDQGRHLLRIQLDALDPTRVVATERLLEDRIGGVRIVAVAPDGAIYLGTADSIGKLVLADH